MKSSFLILLYMFIMQTKNSTEDDLPYESKECTTRVSHRESQRISYLETYRERTWGIFYKTKYRWNYRTEYHTVWNIERRCCSMYREQDNKCFPICFRDCGEGDCITPSFCSCHKGYINSPLSQGPYCVPYCVNTCVNGRCTAPDVCTCDTGYSIEPDGFTCEPVCQPSCDSLTSVCTKPNTCSCREGYTKFGLTSCVPVCEKTCVNGRCTEPDVCTCDEGYSLDLYDRFTCNPDCDKCIGGTCTAPNVCTCHEGYSLSDEGVCIPVCNGGCHMGICIAPETCMCHKGYGFRDLSMNVCEPICPDACINGYCVKPYICECHEGFEVTGDKTSLHVCKPRCNFTCEPEGVCTAPDVCTCNEGYSLDYTNDGTILFDGQSLSVCKPICEKECVNGFCGAPGKCYCSLGYEHTDDIHICKPICVVSCPSNSSCTAPGVCTCDKGYEMLTNQNDSSECVPICQPACPSHAVCTAPGLCLCEDGYITITDYEYMNTTCEPICEFSCNNGTCTSPNVCTCDFGYVNEENGTCIPRCTMDCGNGTCTEPDICSCDEGYALTNGSLTCKPYCENNCDNGDCVAPDECRCHDGFFNNDNGNNTICVSACKDECNERGDCVGDQGNCDCYYGWSGTSCEEPTVCVVVVLEEYQVYETLSLVFNPNNSMIFASASNPTCQQCLNEVNNRTTCYESLYDNTGERNYSAVCFVDASSMCNAKHSPAKEVLRISVAVGGVAVLIMIASIAVACLKFRKKKKTGIVDKSSKDEISRENLLSEDNTSL